MTTEEIPQVTYRIRKVEPSIFGLFFYHGYIREYEDTFLCKAESVDHLKAIAQSHWNDYVNEKFLEDAE